MPNTKTRPDLYQQITDRIIAALKQGAAPWVRPWSTAVEPGPQRNGSSGHVYRGINVLLLAMSGFASSRWYTYKQAKALGGYVRRGEKGTKIAFWRFIEPRGAEEVKADGDDDQKSSNRRKIPILRLYTVFNSEQVEWPEGSKHAPAESSTSAGADHADDNYDRATALVASSGAEITHQGVRACYQPDNDRIFVPAVSRFEGAPSYHATVLHELAHWTGHETRLDRNLTGRFGSESYAAEELVAELAAAFLCSEFGIDGKLQHAEYVGSWIKVLSKDKRAIFTASRLAQTAADYLLAFRNEATDEAAETVAEAA